MSKEMALSELVRQVGTAINTNLESNAKFEIDNELDDWMSRHGLDRAPNPELTLSHLTAYNRLLKITLYALYQINGPDLPQINSTKEISELLALAHEETGDSAFAQFILDEIADSVDDSVFDPLFEIRHHLVNSDNPTEDIGRVFEELVPQASRRKLGQFRTPENVARLMAEWTILNGNEVVLDPGMGAGVLTAFTYDVKKRNRSSTNVGQMWGVDLSELAVVMTATALKSVDGFGTPNLIHGEFLESVGDSASIHIDQDQPHTIPKFDAIVSNPPYTRHHELEKDAKERMNRTAESEADMTVSKRAPMYHYFYIHATQVLRPGGRMAFVTPSEFLETNYGEQLKEFLLNNFAIRGMVIYESNISVFESARTTSCISFLEKKRSRSAESTTTFIKLTEWPGISKILKALEGKIEGETEYGFVNNVPQDDLLPTMKWTRFTKSNSLEVIPGLIPLQDIAEVKRGIATGNNDYFCLSQREVDDWGLSEDYLAKLIRRTDGTQYYDLRTEEDLEEWRRRGKEVWLLYCYRDGEPLTEIDDLALSAYLNHGKEVGAADSYLAKNRTPWYRVDQRSPADILVTYMNKDGFRFIRNEAGVLSLNNLHNVYLKDGYSEREVDALLAYLNSRTANEIVARNGRTYARGLKKIEPNELKDIPVLDPRRLTNDEIDVLQERFLELCQAARSGENQVDTVKNKLNKAVSRVLSSYVKLNTRDRIDA